MKKIALILFISFSSMAQYERHTIPYRNHIFKSTQFQKEMSFWISALLLTYTNDEKIYSEIQKLRKHKTLLDVSPHLEKFGRFELYYLSLISTGLGATFKQQKIFDAGVISLTSLIASGLVTTSIKHLFGRHRPRVGDGAYTYELGFKTTENNFHSLNSGDASNAFAVAASLSAIYQDNKAVVYSSYFLASLVAINRVFNKAHWPSDVLVGAFIGHYTGKKVSAMFLKKEKENNRWFLTPLISHQGSNESSSRYGLRATLSY